MDQDPSEDDINTARDSPQQTMPDIERDPQVSSHWPLQLGFYSREKKLIRDVSGNMEKFKQVP